jgi:hypothetical protein
MAHPFLSDAWFDEVEKIVEEAGELEPAPGTADLKLNIVVTGGPDGDREVHLAAGQFGRGLLDDAPTKLLVPMDIARKVFIDEDRQAGMQAFMQGQIKVEGDMSRLMAMQSSANAPVPPERKALQDKIKEITE